MPSIYIFKSNRQRILVDIINQLWCVT